MPKTLKKKNKLILSKKNTRNNKIKSRKNKSNIISKINRNKRGGSKKKVIKGKRKSKKKMRGKVKNEKVGILGKKKIIVNNTKLKKYSLKGGARRRVTSDRSKIFGKYLINERLYDEEIKILKDLNKTEIENLKKLWEKRSGRLDPKNKKICQVKINNLLNQGFRPMVFDFLKRYKIKKSPLQKQIDRDIKIFRLFFTQIAITRISDEYIKQVIGKVENPLLKIEENNNVNINLHLNNDDLKKLFLDFFWRDMCHDNLYSQGEYPIFLVGLKGCMGLLFEGEGVDGIDPTSIIVDEKIAHATAHDKIIDPEESESLVELIKLSSSEIIYDDRFVTVDQFKHPSTSCFLNSSIFVLNIPKREDKGWYKDKTTGEKSQILEKLLADQFYSENEILENVTRIFLETGSTNIELCDSIGNLGFKITYELTSSNSNSNFSLSTVLSFKTPEGIETFSGILNASDASLYEKTNNLNRFVRASQKTWGDLGMAFRAMSRGEIFLTGDRSIAAFILDFWRISLKHGRNLVNENFVLLLEKSISGDESVKSILHAYCSKGKTLQTVDTEKILFDRQQLKESKKNENDFLHYSYNNQFQGILTMLACVQIYYEVTRKKEFPEYNSDDLIQHIQEINITDYARSFLISDLGMNAIAFTKKNILFLLINNSNPEPYYLHLSDHVRSHISEKLKYKYPNIEITFSYA